ncbi:MAG TPA: fibronectin type III domain-containing protein [Longimicrobiales bacterium]|nr:fibronectin type III domain-containing protein [Longimicrobiales bacterium]
MLNQYHKRDTARFAMAAVALLVATGCSEVSITTVRPAVVEISPPSSFVRVDASTRLSASVRSADGALLSGRTVHWRSLQEAIAEVDGSGNVVGKAPGTATIEATAEGVTGTAAVTVTSGPAIQLTPDVVEFDAVAGGANPGDRTVAIGNPGDGTLNGLSATVTYPPGQPEGWLSAQLASTAAPTTLTLRATTGSLPTGTYTATVNVASAAAQNSPRPISVTFTVGPAQPVIGLQPATLAFTATQAGASPAAQTVQISNTGGGTLSGLSTSVTYPGGQPQNWLTVSLSGTTAPATLTVGATTGSLASGTYTATIGVSASGAANSPQQVSVSFEVAPPPVPGVPTGLQANAVSMNRIDLAWDAASGVVSGYRIERRRGDGSFALLASVPATTRTYEDNDLDAGTTYSYRVQACNVGGCSGYSGEASATTHDAPPLTPATPGSVAATPVSTSEIRIDWSHDGATVTSFELQRAVQTDPNAFTPIASTGPLARSYLNTGLQPETTYYYRVRACNLTVCSNWSEVASTTTLSVAGVPAVPANLTAVGISTSEIRLTWDPPGGQTHYQLRRRIGGQWTYEVTVPGNTAQYIDSGLSSGTMYQYQISACSLAGCSDYSGTASARTQ